MFGYRLRLKPWINIINPIYLLIPLKLCLAAYATHNFKWVEITDICLSCDQTFANVESYRHDIDPCHFEYQWFYQTNKTDKKRLESPFRVNPYPAKLIF